MRRIRFQSLAIIAIGMILLFAHTSYSQMSIDGQYNIAELMQTAENSFDLNNQDAVFLLDKKRVDWLPDGRMIEKNHRIIWIGTSFAVDTYGDHRIPSDSKRCNFNVTTVRTWRDSTWWVTGETGIVETLPHELGTAHDYTNMREMMLLHNGIEIPCILEIAYDIEDKEPFRANIEGHWNLKRMEPCLKSILVLGIPKGEDFKCGKHPDVPDYVRSEDKDLNLDLYTWQMGPLDAMPYPRTEELKKLEPYITWSTWDSWSEYASYMSGLLRGHAFLEDSILKAVRDSIREEALTFNSCLTGVLEYVRKKARLVDYPWRYWLELPRKADRIHATGYCHTLDRAILLLAFYEKMDGQAEIIFVSKNHIPEIDVEKREQIQNTIPALGDLYDIIVEMKWDDIHAYYNPYSDELTFDNDWLCGRYYWRPADTKRNWINYDVGVEAHGSPYRVDLTLEYSQEDEKFIGTGELVSGGNIIPYGEILGNNSEMKDYLAALISGIFKDAELTSFNPEIIKERSVYLSFKYSIPKPEANADGRIELQLQNPPDGIFGRLPEDVALFQAARTSSIVMDDVLSQVLYFRLKLDGIEILGYPDDFSTNNTTGYISISTNLDDNYLLLSNHLLLDRAVYSPDEWPDLRQLLLAETHDRNQTIYLKIKEDKKQKD